MDFRFGKSPHLAGAQLRRNGEHPNVAVSSNDRRNGLCALNRADLLKRNRLGLPEDRAVAAVHHRPLDDQVLVAERALLDRTVAGGDEVTLLDLALVDEDRLYS